MGARTTAAIVVAGCLLAVPVALASKYQYEPGEGLQRASEFETFRVHFAGDQVDQSAIEAVLGGREVKRTSWSFIYGDCTPPAGEGGCHPPLEVQTTSTCSRYRDIYPGKQGSFSFRGAQASRRGGAPFEIYTGRVTIAIFGERELVKEAAREVRPVDQDAAGRLKPPVKGSLTGDLPCQDPPSEFPF